MSFIIREKNKIKLIRQIYNINNNKNYNSRTKSKNRNEYNNIIIPEPKKRIKRSILGNITNNKSLSSISISSDCEIIKEYITFKIEELKCIREISNLSLISNYNKLRYIKKEKNLKENSNITNKYFNKEIKQKENNKSISQNNNNKYKQKDKYELIKNSKAKEIIGKENKMNWKNDIHENQYTKMNLSLEFNEKEENSNDDNEINNKFLPCRKEEQLKIYNYIKNGLKTNGNYNSLYIGGMPGTGKTECIQKVIDTIEIENRENNDIPFRVLFLNCINFPKTSKLFKSIYDFIFSSKKSPKVKSSKFIKILDDFFWERKTYNGNINLNDPSNTHILLVLDEIDYLINKSQFLLYHIFNWTTYPNSKLIIISISNLLNISNHLLPKISSRLGQNKIMFKPYNKEQIRKIINYKGIDLQKFDEDALKLSSMKVAALNGDLRRVILILNKAKELFNNDLKINKIEKNNLINKFYILNACNELFDCKITNAIKNFKLTEKLVISALLLKNKNNDNNSVKLEEIYDYLYILISKYNEYNLDNGNCELDINWNEFQKIIYYLLRIKIIELNDKEFINFKDNYVHIKFYVDEFMVACEYDEEFKPIFNFLANMLN